MNTVNLPFTRVKGSMETLERVLHGSVFVLPQTQSVLVGGVGMVMLYTTCHNLWYDKSRLL